MKEAIKGFFTKSRSVPKVIVKVILVALVAYLLWVGVATTWTNAQEWTTQYFTDTQNFISVQ